MAKREPTKRPEIATDPNILDRVTAALRSVGVVGEDRLVKLTYLAMTSRFLEMPVSLAVKGPSSAGKSFVVRRTVKFFPKHAYDELTAMSERALAYSKKPLSHRMLVIYEEAGIQGEMGSYLVRSLLSEGEINYETVEKTQGGQFQTRQFYRKGPTGLILTTTKFKIHPENETRLLSVPPNDTAEQTRNILLVTAVEDVAHLDVAEWHALQEWLGEQKRDVTLPFGPGLAELLPIFGIRLRRDFGKILNLIRTHALLHQASRRRARDGRIVATLDDYEAVRLLVADLVAEGLESAVPPTVRETVRVVQELKNVRSGGTVSIRALSDHLEVDKSTASRRASRAIELGYLENLESRPGRPALLQPGDPLPDDLQILPSREDLAAAVGCCSVAGVSGGRGEEEVGGETQPGSEG